MQISARPGSVWRTVIEHRPLIASIVIFGWAIKYSISLALSHTTGAEIYGLLTAVLASGAAAANLALLRSSRMSVVVVGAVLVLWAVVAFGGLAGTIAHLVGPVPGHGPIDLRPRPIVAPLVFTLLGRVGGTALSFGWRAARRRGLPDHE
jgi:hypothetical protein